MTTRSPYRRTPKLTVRSLGWNVDDVVQVNGIRWIIRAINGREVQLTASNTSAPKRLWWTTTLNHLPVKVGKL